MKKNISYAPNVVKTLGFLRMGVLMVPDSDCMGGNIPKLTETLNSFVRLLCTIPASLCFDIHEHCCPGYKALNACKL